MPLRLWCYISLQQSLVIPPVCKVTSAPAHQWKALVSVFKWCHGPCPFPDAVHFTNLHYIITFVYLCICLLCTYCKIRLTLPLIQNSVQYFSTV